MGQSYYNTNNESGQTLQNSEGKAVYQEEIVLAFLKKNSGVPYPAHTVHKECFESNVPLTSCRRAITNLEKDGLIELVEGIMVTGLYGKQVHVWRFKQQKGQLKLL